MIARLKEINPRLADPVNETVFLADSPRPGARKAVLQSLWFTYAGEWIPKGRFDQL
jgi:hypothetical protein